MKSFFRAAFCLIAIVFATSGLAASKFPGGPSPGLWWNPNESGRGYDLPPDFSASLN